MLPHTSIPAAPAKLQDIQKQLKYVPVTYQGFYKNLCASEEHMAVSESEDDATEVDATITQALSQISTVN